MFFICSKRPTTPGIVPLTMFVFCSEIPPKNSLLENVQTFENAIKSLWDDALILCPMERMKHVRKTKFARLTKKPPLPIPPTDFLVIKIILRVTWIRETTRIVVVPGFNTR